MPGVKRSDFESMARKLHKQLRNRQDWLQRAAKVHIYRKGPWSRGISSELPGQISTPSLGTPNALVKSMVIRSSFP